MFLQVGFTTTLNSSMEEEKLSRIRKWWSELKRERGKEEKRNKPRERGVDMPCEGVKGQQGRHCGRFRET
jgi:hypothetical protein